MLFLVTSPMTQNFYLNTDFMRKFVDSIKNADDIDIMKSFEIKILAILTIIKIIQVDVDSKHFLFSGIENILPIMQVPNIILSALKVNYICRLILLWVSDLFYE